MVDEVNTLRDSRRTDTVTWRQLDDAWSWPLLMVTCIALWSRRKRSLTVFAAGDIAETLVDITQAFALERAEAPTRTCFSGRDAVRNSIASHERDLDGLGSRREMSSRLAAIGETARKMAMAMEFDFLLDPPTHVALHRILGPGGSADESCYDLLASEARLASYVAIAKGDLPARHWFRLGHDVTPVDGSAALISWSGSMFEYLMPSIVMRTPTMQRA